MRSGFGRHGVRWLVMFVSLAVAVGGVIPPGAVLAQTATAPPPSGTSTTPGEADARKGRVVERPAITLGLPQGAGPGGGLTGTKTPLDPSIKLRPTHPQDKPPKDPTAIEWTERSEIVANPDGTYTLTATGGRMNFQDTNGKWKRVDLAAVAEANGVYTLKVKANDRDVRLAERGVEQALARLATSKGALTLRALDFPDAVLIDEQVDPSLSGKFIGGTDRAKGLLRFRQDTASPDLFVRTADKGFEYGFVVASADQGAPVTFALDVGDLVATLGEDGSILLGDERTGEAAGVISAPILLDANEMPAPASAVTVTLASVASGDQLPPTVSERALAAVGDQELLVTYAIDPAWLAAPDRAFPVTLDPTACLGEGASGCDINGTGLNLDHFVMNGLPTLYPINWTIMRVGYDSRTTDNDNYGVMRGLVYFADVALPDGAVVYDTDLQLHVSSTAGSPGGNDVYAYRITDGWGQTTTWNQFTNGAGYTTTGGVFADAEAAGNLMHWDVDAIVQSWYTRRGTDWKPDIGFAIRMNPDSSGNGEVGFDRYNDATASFRPKLTITYERPHVSIDFDPALGVNYAPSTMLVNTPTVLPIRITNNNTSLIPNFSTADWRIGYRWFDAKGKVVGTPVSQALTACVGTGTGCTNPSATIGLNVTPPASVGQYTLRLDLVRNGTVDQYASDWAKPSLFLSRNKKTLSSDGTRWTGSSIVERDEFGISVVDGASGNGSPRSVETGSGGELSIDLWSKNLAYKGAGGIGFSDLVPLELDYGYDSRLISDCSGILDACGWSTTFDERFMPGATADAYTYVDESGDRHLVDADGDQQLTSGAGVLLERPRTTVADENVPTSTTGAVLTTPPSFGPFSGSYVTRVPLATDPGVSLGPISPINLNTYRYLRMAIGTDGYASTGLAVKIRNNTKATEKWFIYTIGTAWNSTFPDELDLGGAVANQWRYIDRNLYQDIRNDGDFGGSYDDYQVIGINVQNPPNATGFVYLDALRLEPGITSIIADTNPTWSTGGTGTSVVTTDKAAGSSSIRINAAAISSSPDCHTTLPSGTPCWSTSAGGLWAYGFVRWQWKKVGGRSAAIVFHLKNIRTGATGDLTYYAGPTAPVGAINALQVSDVPPADWSRVTRNLLQDARQVLNWFNDNAGSTSPSAPPSQGPTPDDVQMTGYRISGVDGNFLLFDDFSYQSLPDVGAEQLGHPNSASDETFIYDFTVTDRDGTVKYFNSLGLLERIVDRDGHTVELDWSIPSLTVVGQNGYRLDRIRAPTDGATSGSWTYNREIEVTYTTGTDRTVTFTEELGSVSVPVTGRSTTFTVNAANDVSKVKPARTPTCAASGSASGCDLFQYTGSHLLQFVGDPRWNQTSTGGGPSDLRFEVTWSGTNATGVVDRSQTAAQPILRVIDAAGSALPAAKRVAWLDDAGIRLNYARYVDLTSDGKALYEYIPLVCLAAACGSLPDTAGLASKKATESQFDGLARESTTITYRCTGVAVSGCPATAQQVISRQGTKAGAKVDNYVDPLTGGQVGWTQSADQYVASLRDSGGVDKDLYRTFYSYDDNGQQVATSRTAHNARPDYPATIKSTSQFASALKGYWRLGEAAGPTAIDSAPTPHNGTYTGSATPNQAPALVNDADKAATFNGTTSYVSIPSSFGTLTGSFSVGAWVKPASATTTMAFIGSRAGTASPTEYSFNVKLHYDASTKIRGVRVDVGNGSAWLLANVTIPFDYQANRWYHIVATVDDAGDRVTVYVNGDPVGQAAMTAGTPLVADADNLIRIGSNGRTTTTPEWWNGQIDEVSIWSQVLTAPQVESQYLSGHSVALATSKTLRDRNWRPIQVDDQKLASPGFESGLVDWDFGQGSGGIVYTTTNPSDANVHQPLDPTLPRSWASFKTGPTGNAQQDVQLVPGQTVRLQLWERRDGTTPTARVNLYYWQKSSGSWQALINAGYTNSSWTSHAWDVTLPFDTDGRVRVALWVASATGTDTIWFDEVALLTTYARTNYTTLSGGDAIEGLTKNLVTFSPQSSGPIAEFTARSEYGATSTVPPIFPTKATSNYVDGTYASSAPDTDVSMTSVFDAWGRTVSATDQDGVTTFTDYVPGTSSNGYATDVAATRNVYGESATFQYDLVGNKTHSTTPKGETTITTYDLRGHELTVTAPAPSSTVTKNVYDANGFLTSSIENRVDDAPSSGLDDVTTSYVYDEYGETTTTTENTGVAGNVQSRTTSLHDLLGNETSSTEYSTYNGSAFGGGRTTTQHVEVANGAWRGEASASRGPGTLVPSGAPAPACPDGSGSFCNSVTKLDQDGAEISQTDSYGVVSRTFRNLAGNPVFEIESYVDGVYSATTPDVDLVTTTQLDFLGRPAVTIDPLGRKTVTAFDALGRATKKTAYDWNAGTQTATAVSDVRTVYTGSGRVDRVSMPGASSGADSTFAWTKSIYDRAGRVIKTLAHHDAVNAGLAIDSFETSEADRTIDNDGTTESWSVLAGAFIAAGATKSLQLPAASAISGAGRLSITTGTVANTGVEWNLDGTFVSGHAYKGRVWVNPPSGTTVDLRLGVAADAASDASPVVGNGSWQALDVTWTPTANRTSVKLAVFRVASGTAATFALDNAITWDSAAGATDVNIPSETAYDANGKVVASILAPGTVGGSEEPMVTRTVYDALGRVTSITVNEVAGGGTGNAVNLTNGTTYDALGREATKTDPTGTVMKYTYDRLGRLTETTQNYLDGSASGQYTDDDVTSTFGYNAAGEMIGYCSGAQVWLTGCDPTDPSDPQAWRYEFNDAGEMVRQIPPLNVGVAALTTSLTEYDAGGRITRTCDVDPSTTATCTAASGVLRSTVRSYDKVGRTTRSDVFAGPGATLTLRTDTKYLGDGQVAESKFSTGSTPTVVDTIEYQYDNLGRNTKLTRNSGALTLSERSYNADGTVAWRKDGDGGAIGQTDFTYDWADRLLTANLPDTTFSTAVPTFGWRLDGLIGSRTWSTGAAATFSYDAAKRPTGLTKGSLQFTQTFDRDGNVVTDGRTLTGVSGDAGTNPQTFTYDALNRVTGSTGLAETRSYQYDRDSNRTQKTVAGVTFAYAYHRTGELAQVTKGVLPAQTFTYDQYGNMLNDAQTGTSIISYAYDLDDRLTTIDDPGGNANDATFTLDALGRFRTRVLGGGTSTDTYSYQDTSEAVVRIANSVSGSTDSLLSANGDRLGVRVGSTVNWFLPDLHGDIGASLDAGEATVVNAIRYDAYGEIVQTGTAGGTRVGDKSWKYQGQLDISPEGLGAPLYDMGARFYAPANGTFTQLDSVLGSAQNPITMNRFLYAGGNPATLVDPSGHCFIVCIDIDPGKFVGEVANNVANFGIGVAEGVGSTLIEGGKALVQGAVAAGGCALSSSCRDSAIASVQRGVAAFAADPGKALRSAASTVWEGAKGMIKSTIDRASYAWSTGNFRELGKMTGEVAANFIPVGGVLAKGGQLIRGLSTVGRGFAGAGRFGSGFAAAGRFANRLDGVVDRLRASVRRVETPRSPTSCALHSFSGDTPVATLRGSTPIANLRVGDLVLAQDTATGALAERPVTYLHVNDDPVTGTVTIDDEPIDTTPNHPFYTLGRGWIPAEDLVAGDQVASNARSHGIVTSSTWSGGPSTMYNLTVAVDHTFFVGEGQWLVHNCKAGGGRHPDALPEGETPYQLKFWADEPYNRRKHYGHTPTARQTAHVNRGRPTGAPRRSFDHRPPLVRHYYQGPGRGRLAGHNLLPYERRRWAQSLSGGRGASIRSQRIQGGRMSWYSRRMRGNHGLR